MNLSHSGQKMIGFNLVSIFAQYLWLVLDEPLGKELKVPSALRAAMAALTGSMRSLPGCKTKPNSSLVKRSPAIFNLPGLVAMKPKAVISSMITASTSPPIKATTAMSKVS